VVEEKGSPVSARYGRRELVVEPSGTLEKGEGAQLAKKKDCVRAGMKTWNDIREPWG